MFNFILLHVDIQFLNTIGESIISSLCIFDKFVKDWLTDIRMGFSQT